MKTKTIKTKLSVIALTSCLALQALAGTFTDTFGASHNYVTQGAVGTGWEGVSLGVLDKATVTQMDANSTAASTLTTVYSGGAWGYPDDGPFMWKLVSGDFTNTVHVSLTSPNNYNVAGLMVMNPNSPDNYIQLGTFSVGGLNNWGLCLAGSDYIDGTSFGGGINYQNPGYDFSDPSTWPDWLQITRVGTTIQINASTDGVNWMPVYTSPRDDLSGAVQVGIYQSAYSSDLGTNQFQNFSITGPDFNNATPPAQASSLVVVTNNDASLGLSWTAGAGSAGSVVVVRDLANGPINYQPSAGLSYTGNAAFGSGDNLGEGNYVVYSGAGNSVTVTGLTPSHTYQIAVYSYSGSGATAVYNLSTPASQTALAKAPVVSVSITAPNMTMRPTIPASSQATVIADYGIYGTNDVTANPQTVYASLNPSVATVNASGLITGVSLGSADITATYGGITATQAVNVVTPTYTINTADLFCAVTTSNLPAVGQPIPTWQTYVLPTDSAFVAAFGSPAVVSLAGILWEQNNWNTAGSGFWLTNALASGPEGQITGGIACDGASVFAVVNPIYSAGGDGWNAVFSVFNNRFMLSVHRESGMVEVLRNGNVFNLPDCVIPFGQTTVLGLVVQPDGSFKVYTNGVLAHTESSTDPLVLPDSGSEYQQSVCIGRANKYDGWSAFNGLIGDVYFYTNAVSDDSRMALEDNLISRFIVAATNGYTITASSGPNGTVNPSGSTFVLQGYGQTYTITPATTNYLVGDVLVDGVSVGTVLSYTFTGVNANHTISASFIPWVQYPITPSAGSGGFISPSVVSNYVGTTTPTFTFTANVGYQITNVLVDGISQGEISSYTFAPLTSGHTISVAFAPIGVPVPNSDQLIVAVVTDGFTHSNGAVLGTTWPTLVPTVGPAPTNMTLTGGAVPAVSIIGGVNYMHSDRDAGDAGYQYSSYPNTVPSSGASMIVVVKPTYNASSTPEWDSVFSMFSGRFGIGVNNADGQINVERNNISAPGTAIGVYLPDGQITVLSLVMQANGNYVVYTNGVAVFTNNTASPLVLTPGIDGYQQNITLGRRNMYDGWTTFNGDIGDAYLYTTALSDANRQTLEASLMNKFINSATNQWTVTTSAGAGGSITPAGATTVTQGDNTDLAYTITANTGFSIAQVNVDGAPVGPLSSYTFNAVNTNHSISATFMANINPNPTNILYSVSGTTLSLSWPNSSGWILQQQTNSLSVGISTNWVDVPGSEAITSTNIAINPQTPAIFYRLRLP